MRAILLDWLIEVCEVYKLHRETYYLAVDYLDRYLSTNTKISKTRLQLIGITCLFVAAKVSGRADFLTIEKNNNKTLYLCVLGRGNLSAKNWRICLCHRWCLS